MVKLKLAVLISGRGSNLKALIDACAARDFPATVVMALSDRKAAPGLAHAVTAGIPTATVNRCDYINRNAFDRALSAAISAQGTDLVCLAGFMSILGAGFVARWQNRLINIHPSLLPDFPGLDTHARVLASGESTTGCTVHFVTAAVDAGAIIIQQAVAVEPSDTPESLAARVLAAEHKLYPQAIQRIATTAEGYR